MFGSHSHSGNRSVLVATLICLAMPATVLAQGGVSGPDVITYDVYDLEHWGSSGGIDAYSVGTVSCNEGDTDLLWQSWSNQRPVIGQNMFRLKDGRFEQIGQSWLKWAFASLNQNACGNCDNPGTGSLLGPNCSDPYSAWLNGSQSGLGPKSSVNPFTGDLPANHATPGSGTIAGRVQVPTPDVDPAQNAGALYFVEGQYVTPDDAASGNLHNNASYRQVWVSGSRNISFNMPGGGTSQTVRRQPAIVAWSANDPAVKRRIVDVPDDGRFYYSVRVTPVSAGVWDYEFAIQNLNVDRCIGSVTIPLPDGANVSSQGFHDVDYHSGEPFDGTDWAMSAPSGSVMWETDDYATNVNANALRWGTLYNFRFVADVYPGAVQTMEIGLFKPGTPASMSIDLPELAPPIEGDLDADGDVDFDDLNLLLAAYGSSTGDPNYDPAADLDGDGDVDFDDLNLLLANYGT